MNPDALSVIGLISVPNFFDFFDFFFISVPDFFDFFRFFGVVIRFFVGDSCGSSLGGMGMQISDGSIFMGVLDEGFLLLGRIDTLWGIPLDFGSGFCMSRVVGV